MQHHHYPHQAYSQHKPFFGSQAVYYPSAENSDNGSTEKVKTGIQPYLGPADIKFIPDQGDKSHKPLYIGKYGNIGSGDQQQQAPLFLAGCFFLVDRQKITFAVQIFFIP